MGVSFQILKITQELHWLGHLEASTEGPDRWLREPFGFSSDRVDVIGLCGSVLAAMASSVLHGQKAERAGGTARRQEVGVRFLSKCQEMNSSVESNPGHILEEILWV